MQQKEDLGQILSLVDQDIVHYPWEMLELFMKLALRCCERLPDDRPNMAEVVRKLENIASGSSHLSSTNGYVLDMSEPHIDSDWNSIGNSLHSVSVAESERSDTIELLSKTVTFVKPR